jgi:hypothetical protein
VTLRRFGVLVALLTFLAVGGCAGESSVPSAPASPTKSGAPGAEAITGTVTAGVEPDCLLLAGERDAHLLVFEDESLRAQAKVGARLTVTGRAEPDMMTTCQQGIPFIVTAVRPAS